MCGSRSESNTSMTFWPISIRRSRRPCPCKKPREGKDQGLAQSPPLFLERAMPIILPSGLPAATELEAEGYDVLRSETEVRSERPIRIGLLNLMPTKPATEAQFARLLSEGTSAVELELIRPATHNVRQGGSDHLDRFYRTWGEVGHTLDAFIVTGAPAETLAFEDLITGRNWRASSTTRGRISPRACTCVGRRRRRFIACMVSKSRSYPRKPLASSSRRSLRGGPLSFGVLARAFRCRSPGTRHRTGPLSKQSKIS